ncbi:MAG: nuclear transport factor 2 family protein [Polyangia bacterium]
MTSPLSQWHHIVSSKDASLLEAIIAEDAVFFSPAVHTPQRGRAIVCAYLRAAVHVFGNETFRYTNEWHAERSAVLEFELQLGDIAVNGVDLVRWNEAGLIVEFKVMVRPLKGLNTVVEHMAKALGAK